MSAALEMTMRERVAGAILEAMESQPPAFVGSCVAVEDSVDIDGWFDLGKIADAVLEEMREPSDAMVNMGENCGDQDDRWSGPRDCWHLMIDAAINSPN